MSATGVEKQEKKIEELAMVVEELHPGLAHLSIKGAFRFGISTALEEHGFSDWKSVADQPANTREKFFESICDNSISRLAKIGFPREKHNTLRDKLIESNKKYLQS